MEETVCRSTQEVGDLHVAMCVEVERGCQIEGAPTKMKGSPTTNQIFVENLCFSVSHAGLPSSLPID